MRIQTNKNFTETLCIYNVLGCLSNKRWIRRIEGKNWYLLRGKGERILEKLAKKKKKKHVWNQRTPCVGKGWCRAKWSVLFLCVWKLHGVTFAIRFNYTSVKNSPEKFMGIVLRDHYQIPSVGCRTLNTNTCLGTYSHTVSCSIHWYNSTYNFCSPTTKTLYVKHGCHMSIIR